MSQTPATAESVFAPGIDAVLRDLVHRWNRHDLERVVALYSADYKGTDVGCPGAHRGPAAAGECFARYWEAFPDLRLAAKDRIVEGNRAAVAWTARGTHEGTFMHIPATGRKVAVRGVSFLTLDGDRVSRAFHVWDVAGLLRAVRLLPDL